VLPLSGIPVYYYRCPNCDFLFTRAFDEWTPADFTERIYNADYIKVDPGYREERAVKTSKLVRHMFGRHARTLTVLDYGGGNGRLAELLRETGFSAASYDPVVDSASRSPAAEQQYSLITAFEVFEHLPDPVVTTRWLAERLAADGLLMISTFTSDKNLKGRRLDWYYASPRNGHISLYSMKSLLTLFSSAGLQFSSAADDLHFGFRRFPDFALHLIKNPRAAAQP